MGTAEKVPEVLPKLAEVGDLNLWRFWGIVGVEEKRMYIGLFLFVAAWAALLTWAKWTRSRRVYRALWFVAATIMILVGLAL